MLCPVAVAAQWLQPHAELAAFDQGLAAEACPVTPRGESKSG